MARALPTTHSKNLKKSDFIYALEVANQPAETRASVYQKAQAKLDLKYLKNKFPGIRKEYNLVKGTKIASNKKYKLI